jgi:hypothetical protein
MATRRTKVPIPKAPDLAETSSEEREALASVYQAGLIQAWKHESERGFRLTFKGRPDEYVEVGKLRRYLDKLRGVA